MLKVLKIFEVSILGRVDPVNPLKYGPETRYSLPLFGTG